MGGLDLRLPSSLVPQAIRGQTPIKVANEYFLAITSGRTPIISLPRPLPKVGNKRFSLRKVFDGLYLASEKKAAICEVWDAQNESLLVDLYSVSVELDGVFDLRSPGVQADLELSKDCFGLANPPDPQDRDYVAWQYLAYVIWSGGFDGVIWKSARYAGDSLCVWRLGPTSSIDDLKPVELKINVRDWLRYSP